MTAVRFDLLVGYGLTGIFGVAMVLVAAVVQATSASNVDEEALRAHVAARLAAFKVPARIELRSDPLPRNPSGKILKRELKEAMARATG